MNIKEEELKKLKKQLRDARKEIGYLNELLNDVQENCWDYEGLYEDARDGTFNGNDIGGKPDKKFAKWLAQRYGLKIDKDGDIIKDEE